MNKYQRNEAIENEPKFDNIFSSSSGTKDHLTVVTVSLRGGKKHRATTVAGLTCLWDSGATNSMIKKRQTKYYERKMWSNKVESNIVSELYCTMHEIKVPFFMQDFSSSSIIEHRFHVNKNNGKSGIGYDMIIGCNLMVQLGLMADFKRQVLQWDGATVPMK